MLSSQPWAPPTVPSLITRGFKAELEYTQDRSRKHADSQLEPQRPGTDGSVLVYGPSQPSRGQDSAGPGGLQPH